MARATGRKTGRTGKSTAAANTKAKAKTRTGKAAGAAPKKKPASVARPAANASRARAVAGRRPANAGGVWQTLGRAVAQLGALRLALLAMAALTILLKPAAGTPAEYEGWGMMSTLIVPVMAPVIWPVLLLDALMGRVFMVEKHGAERARLRLIVTVNLAAAGLMLLFWVPYYAALFSR